METHTDVGKAMQQAGKARSSASTALARAKKPNTLIGLKSTDVAEIFKTMQPQIARALPKHLTPDRIIQMAVTTVVRNPAIMECSVPSIIGAILQASILGFPPVESLGYCYLVPYNRKTATGYVKEAQFQVGYRGYMELARRSGEIKMIFAEVVREGDEFDYALGLDPKLTHRPAGNINSKVTHAYAVAHYKDGGYNFIVITRNEIESLRMRSPGQKATPTGVWSTDYAAMAKAKAIKQLSKYLPLNLDYHIEVDKDEKVIKLAESDQGEGNIVVESIDYETLMEEQKELKKGKKERAEYPATPEEAYPVTPTFIPPYPPPHDEFIKPNLAEREISELFPEGGEK